MYEQWRAVPGFEGSYEVSSYGLVRSIDRVVWVENRNTTLHYKGRVLRPATMPSGHLCVVLGRRNTRLVHALVMLAFVGARPAKADVLHVDHNPANNTLKNLRYGTRSENMRMDYAAGRRTTPVEFIRSDNGTRKPQNVVRSQPCT